MYRGLNQSISVLHVQFEAAGRNSIQFSLFVSQCGNNHLSNSVALLQLGRTISRFMTYSQKNARHGQVNAVDINGIPLSLFVAQC